ncbi:hypothetical protein [Polaromonas sp.]|uniref:hypothetical protein n=1 Tax=Polaromonas sp. TaxID=1869339 RepID=UPI003266A2AC
MDNTIAAPAEDKGYDSWRAKDDMRTLIESNKIKKDVTRMKHVKRAAKEEMAQITAIKALAA